MIQETFETLGTVRADGTLVLDRKLELPAGPVRVTVQPVAVSAGSNVVRFQAMMDQIWSGQNARGHIPRTREEIDAEVQLLREEAEEELQAAERLHEECQRARLVAKE